MAENLNEVNEMDEELDTVVFTDDENNEHEYDMYLSFDMDDKDYMVLTTVESRDSEELNGEDILIARIIYNDDDTMQFEIIADEDEYVAALEKFVKIIEEEDGCGCGCGCDDCDEGDHHHCGCGCEDCED